MGQGTESCGGYDVDYDAYEEGLATGEWVQRDGRTIKVSTMTTRHLRNCLRICEGMAANATFSSEEEKWNDWVAVFSAEIDLRKDLDIKSPNVSRAPTVKAPRRGTMATMICYCGAEYQAREADLKRGWGLTCCKSHAAIRRDYGRPAAKRKK